MDFLSCILSGTADGMTEIVTVVKILCTFMRMSQLDFDVNLLVLHSVSVKPATQVQVYPLTPSVQVPPFWQGFEAHSSISVRKKNIYDMDFLTCCILSGTADAMTELVTTCIVKILCTVMRMSQLDFDVNLLVLHSVSV